MVKFAEFKNSLFTPNWTYRQEMKFKDHADQKIYHYFFIAISVIFLYSCTPANPSSSKTQIPTSNSTSAPTSESLTQNNSEIKEPSETLLPANEGDSSDIHKATPNFEETQVSIEDNPLLTIPNNFEFPLSTITLFNPGNLSRVTSPFKVVAEIPKSLENRAYVELFGEDGRLIDREMIYNFGLSGFYDLTISAEMEFETKAVAETGLLRITLLDDYGNPLSINSVKLILLRDGNTEIAGYGDLRENLIIQQPQEGFESANSNLFVSGYIRTQDLESLSIKIVNEQGEVLRASEAVILETTNSLYSLFLGSIDYFVESPLEVQLVVESKSLRFSEIIYLSSIQMLLEP